MRCSKCNNEVDGCDECEDSIDVGGDIYCDDGKHVHADCFYVPALARATK